MTEHITLEELLGIVTRVDASIDAKTAPDYRAQPLAAHWAQERGHRAQRRDEGRTAVPGTAQAQGRSPVADLLTAGFTASRDLDERGEGVTVNVLCQLPAARYVTGGCTGGDAFIGRWLALNRPDAEHVVIVPADRSRVDPWWLEPVVRCSALVEIIEMPPGTTYRDRNARLVQESGMFCGFPAYPEDNFRSLRSGSWQALRMARRAGKLCRWDCVKPPYHGRVERWPGEFTDQGGESAP